MIRAMSCFSCLLLLTLAGCGGGDDDASRADLKAHLDVSPAENRALREAPMLAQRVKRGELPPIDERLPENPMVVPTVEGPGLYGGTWRKFDLQPDFLTMRLANNYYGLTRWSPDASRIMPGVAESWEYSEDGKSITFRLRKGLRWSDGEPFTSSDILFWWELCTDERHPMGPPEWAYVDGQVMDVTAPDEYTLVFEFAGPYYFIDLQVATGFWWPEMMMLPRHYLQQFHPDHSDYTDFAELDRKRDPPTTNPDRPTLGPWMLTEYSPTGDKAVFERNPYYWGVDEDGRQLPYIDRVEVTRVQNSESGVLYTMSGAVDAQFRLLEFRDYALLKRFADKGNYKVMAWEEGTAAWHALFVNWSPTDKDAEPDVERRALFRDPKFRRALSLAIDRNMINQVVWNGLSRPQSAAITDESWHFDSPRGQDVSQRWRESWSQHDVALANKLLDEAGLSKRDEEGFRMYRDERFEVRLDYYEDSYATDQAVMIEQDWEAVGIRTLAKVAVPAELDNRRRKGQYDVYMRHNSELDLFTFPSYVFPLYPEHWHPMVGLYMATNGKEGEPPEGFMQELVDIYERCKREPDLAKRHGLVLDAIEIQIEHGPFMIGTTGRQKSIVVVSKDLRNVPRSAIMGPWAQPQPGTSFPEQMYFSEERLYSKGGD